MLITYVVYDKSQFLREFDHFPNPTLLNDQHLGLLLINLL
jgi:hypothetical protein